MTISLTTSAAQSLQTDGYCRFTLPDAPATSSSGSGLARLQTAVDTLPADPYAPSANRYRRYSNGILLPWSRHVEWMPNLYGDHGAYSEYYQADFNPEYRAVVRRMVPFEDELKNDPYLNDIIWHDFDLTFWDEAQLIRPFVVGVHLVKLLVEHAGDIAVSSPDVLHQDGEPFTFVHLVKRDNAAGVMTSVALPSSAGRKPEEVDPATIHEQFSLAEPLESYGVHDPRVSHYVSALEHGREERRGVRAALLTDFTPLVPLLS